MASLHFLTLCFLILMTSLGDIQSETLMGDKCVYEKVTDPEVFQCKAGKQKAETMQLKNCTDVTGSEFVNFQCKVVIIAECGKSISIKRKNNNDIKDVTLQFCSANGSNCSETTHIDRTSANTTTVNERISLNIINNSFTLNISEVQIVDQKEYKFRLHFEKGEGIMVIDLKVVDCMASENATPKPLRLVNNTKNSSIGILMGILILAAVIAVVLYRRKKTCLAKRSNCLH